MMLRLLREKAAILALPLPTGQEVANQLTLAKRELAKYHHLKSIREQRAATVRMQHAQMSQRMVTIQSKEEGKIVHAIERKLGINFRTGEIV